MLITGVYANSKNLFILCIFSCLYFFNYKNFKAGATNADILASILVVYLLVVDT